MADKTITGIVYVLLGIMGLAIIAILVSKQSNTANLFGDFGKTISRMLCTALSPVTGANCGGGVNSLVEDVHSTLTFPT